jgi:hypothetical protein
VAGIHARRIVPDSVFAKSQVASGADADEAPELNKALHAKRRRAAAPAENFGGVGEKLSNSCLVSRSISDSTARNSICKIPVSVNERPVDVQARRNADEGSFNISAQRQQRQFRRGTVCRAGARCAMRRRYFPTGPNTRRCQYAKSTSGGSCAAGLCVAAVPLAAVAISSNSCHSAGFAR